MAKKSKKKAGARRSGTIGKGSSAALRKREKTVDSEGSRKTAQVSARGRGKRTPLENARKLVAKAQECEFYEEQIKLIQKALEACPDCAEAILMLGQMAPSDRESIPLYEEALRAAERVLGTGAFEQNDGSFWFNPEAPPCLQARLELARSLWLTGQGAAAVNHLLEILRLNPGDNQGVRYLLVPWLIELNRDAEAFQWLEQFDESSSFQVFNLSLCVFRREGDGEQARRMIASAAKQNKHVIPLLLGEVPVLPMVFPMYSPGDENEALTYLSEAARAWRFTPGAISWLRRVAAETAGSKKKNVRHVGPTAAAKKHLKRRPQEYGEVWQAGLHQVRSWLTSGGQPVRPWSFLVVDHTNHKILLQEIVPFPPSEQQIWDFVCQAINSPLYGKPHRPSEIQVYEGAAWEANRPHLEEVGIDCIFRTELEEFEFLLRDLDRHLTAGDSDDRAIVHVSGMSEERAASLYAAATSFYRSAPWRTAADDLTITVECPEISRQPVYAVVMGSGGMTIGLAVYRDLQSLHETRYPGLSDFGTLGRRISAVTTLFGEPFELAIPDLAAIEENGWDIAGPEGHPTFMAVHRDQGSAVPDIKELTLIEACLRCVPRFVEQCPFLEPYSQHMKVSVGGREFGITLSWDPAVDSPCGESCTGHCEH